MIWILHATRTPGWLGLAVASAACAAQPPLSITAQVPKEPEACRTLVPAAVGGPRPPASTVVLRWLGTANYEVAYGPAVILLDAYIDRGPRSRPLGVTVDAFQRADLILIGHAHYDHIADAAAIARRTHALVVGAASATDLVRAAGLPAEQTRTVHGRGGELLRFAGFTVEPVLAHHSILQPRYSPGFRRLWLP